MQACPTNTAAALDIYLIFVGASLKAARLQNKKKGGKRRENREGKKEKLIYIPGNFGKRLVYSKLKTDK